MNLSPRYEHSTGREAVLDMLYALILKFSAKDLGKKSFLDQQSETMLVKLALCLPTDTDQKVLSRIGSVIKLLISSISEGQVGSIISVCLCWYKQQRLQAVAAQVCYMFLFELVSWQYINFTSFFRIHTWL